ncbi:hypothetical protein GCM10010466_56980 [Planomonospora alba]|uniref:Uncharacterized protein n=1 Tax=Planomonospora alba TaxID=161354 RepID=A0ABP6NV15_9ACTN
MRHTRRTINVLAGVLLVTSAVHLPGAGTASASVQGCPVTTDKWEAVDLGVVGAALDINDRGQIAGWRKGASGESQAILWDKGKITEIGTLGGRESRAVALDEDGRVTGYSDTADRRTHGFVWHNGKLEDLGTLGGYAALPKDISQGTVIGETRVLKENGTRRGQAFVVRKGVRTDLDLTGGSEAEDINRSGQIAGTHRRTEGVGLPSDKQTQRAFLWKDGVVKDLGTLGGDWSEARGLNGRGQVVGESALGTDGVLQGGFVWSAESGMRRIEDGNGLARPAAINDSGVIVGLHSCETAYSTAYPSVWTDPGKAPARLPDPPGGVAKAVNAVNAKGEIVGMALYSGNQPHAVLWKPKPMN